MHGITEQLKIQNGALGPIAPCEIDVRPFTVFIGKQGTGKSLALQMLYFFREFPFLVSYDRATRRPEEDGEQDSEEGIVRRILDRLRSSQRAFAVFANPSVTLEWKNGNHLALGLYSQNRRARPHQSIISFLQKLDLSAPQQRNAIFIPTERLFYSQIMSPTSLQVLSLPLSFHLFADWMEKAGRLHDGWEDGVPDTDQGQWIRARGLKALAGEGYRRGVTWKWRVGPGVQFDIDMASSGQRANWPLILLAEALFSFRVREVDGMASDLTIYVEEPEIHLHPEAQVALVEILAYLVNYGFRVVLTTHSLTVLYALNNLLQAARLPAGIEEADLPEPAIRLPGDQVAAYLFNANEAALDVMDREAGFINEARLGYVADELSAQMNRIGVLSHWKKG